jgi:hypothetical protein
MYHDPKFCNPIVQEDNIENLKIKIMESIEQF